MKEFLILNLYSQNLSFEAVFPLRKKHFAYYDTLNQVVFQHTNPLLDVCYFQTTFFVEHSTISKRKKTPIKYVCFLYVALLFFVLLLFYSAFKCFISFGALSLMSSPPTKIWCWRTFFHHRWADLCLRSTLQNVKPIKMLLTIFVFCEIPIYSRKLNNYYRNYDVVRLFKWFPFNVFKFGLRINYLIRCTDDLCVSLHSVD